MSKGVQDAGKFLRDVLVKEITLMNAKNLPYTVGDAADLIAYLRITAKDPEVLKGLEAWGCIPPASWGDDKYHLYERDEETNELVRDPVTKKLRIDHEKYMKMRAYGRKAIREELKRAGTPFVAPPKPDAKSGDEDEVKIKPDAGV